LGDSNKLKTFKAQSTQNWDTATVLTIIKF